MQREVITKSARRVRRRKLIRRWALIFLILLILLLVVFYFVSSFIYNSHNFTITLDRNLYLDKNIVIYDDPLYKVFRTELYAPSVEYFDNISEKWLPQDLDAGLGSKNGDSYIAYSFLVENIGDKVSDYYSEVHVVDSIKGVDAAVRIRVYRNGEYVNYAKISAMGTPEVGTTPFEEDWLVRSEYVPNLAPGDIDKYTIVIWIEGSDPETTDNILGGEIKIAMDFKSEFIDDR